MRMPNQSYGFLAAEIFGIFAVLLGLTVMAVALAWTFH